MVRGDPDHPRPARADQDRRVGLLYRLRVPLVVRDRVVLALERERAVARDPLQNLQAFLEATDAVARRAHGDAEPVELRWEGAARADAELEATAGEEIEGVRLLGEQRRVPPVVLPDQRADAHRGRLGDN